MLETIQTPTAAHTRYPSSPAAATLHGKMQGLQFTLRFFSNTYACVFSATRTHPCSHYTAICIHPLSPPASHFTRKKTQGFVLRLAHATVMQPLKCVLQQHAHIHAAIPMRFASTRCRNARNDPNRNRRTHKVPFIAACSHFSTEKTQGFVLRLPPENKPHATVMQPLQCVFAAPRTHPCSHCKAICIHTLQNTKGELIK